MVMNFVSISGVSDEGQLSGISRIIKQEKINFPVAIGYQVSNKSINMNTNKERQPRYKDLKNLFNETNQYGLLPAIHYYTKDNSAIISDLEKIINSGVNPKETLLQLNTLPIDILSLSHVNYYGFKIIFKVPVSDKKNSEKGYAVWKGDNVEDISEGNIKPLLDNVIFRKDFIDYAMFDPSHGTNLELNLDEESMAIKFGKAISLNSALNHIGLVYAGGIKPENVRNIVKSLNKYLPEKFSIDTESGVRKQNKFDLSLVREYLINCQKEINL